MKTLTRSAFLKNSAAAAGALAVPNGLFAARRAPAVLRGARKTVNFWSFSDTRTAWQKKAWALYQKRKKPDFDYMVAYSPYDNVAARPYPALLVKTSFNDSQVMYWEPAKYVARLRTVKTDHNPLLLKTNMAAGHGGASGRYDYLHEVAFDYAFVLTQLGLTQ